MDNEQLKINTLRDLLVMFSKRDKCLVLGSPECHEGANLLYEMIRFFPESIYENKA